MTKKNLGEKIVQAVSAGASALLSQTKPKPLSEMPETPALCLPEGKKATATASGRIQQ